MFFFSHIYQKTIYIIKIHYDLTDVYIQTFFISIAPRHLHHTTITSRARRCGKNLRKWFSPKMSQLLCAVNNILPTGLDFVVTLCEFSAQHERKIHVKNCERFVKVVSVVPRPRAMMAESILSIFLSLSHKFSFSFSLSVPLFPNPKYKTFTLSFCDTKQTKQQHKILEICV